MIHLLASISMVDVSLVADADYSLPRPSVKSGVPHRQYDVWYDVPYRLHRLHAGSTTWPQSVQSPNADSSLWSTVGVKVKIDAAEGHNRLRRALWATKKPNGILQVTQGARLWQEDHTAGNTGSTVMARRPVG